MTLTLTSKKPRSEEELKRIASFGKPDDYEWAKVEQYGAQISIISRSKAKFTSTGSPGAPTATPRSTPAG